MDELKPILVDELDALKANNFATTMDLQAKTIEAAQAQVMLIKKDLQLHIMRMIQRYVGPGADIHGWQYNYAEHLLIPISRPSVPPESINGVAQDSVDPSEASEAFKAHLDKKAQTSGMRRVEDQDG